MQNFIEIQLAVSPQPFSEIVMAHLSTLGFDSFWETEEGVNAYIEQEQYNEANFNDFIHNLKELCTIEVLNKGKLTPKNWNEEWESKFEPVFVGNDLVIKAPFHNIPQSFDYEILIQPKMSFGTGHHATTFLVAKKMLQLNFTDKIVLDFGSGTAILSILAEMLGSSSILAIDNDEWSADNATENASLNNCQKIDIKLGSSEFFEGKTFDVIIANINRAVILDSMQKMSEALNEKGVLLVSGILEQDIEIVDASAKECGLRLLEQAEKDNWVLLVYGY